MGPVEMRSGPRSGQALVFGALTLFVLTAFCVMCFNVGWVSVRRLQLQHAADHAAYAGALAQANVVSEVAWLNEGMAYCYYAAMRYAVDDVVHGTLNEFALHAPVPAPIAVIGEDAQTLYAQSYTAASEWIPRLEHWMEKLSNIEFGMAAVAPALVRKEIFRVVHETLGVDPSTGSPSVQVAVFPDIPYAPDPGGNYALTITRQGNSGWRLEGSDGFWIEILITGPDSYSVTSSTGTSFTVDRLSDDHYRVTTPDQTIDLQNLDGLGWVVSSSGGANFTITPGQNGGWTINGQEYRRGPDGTFERFSGGQWQSMGSADSLVVDGVEVPIQESSITVGDATINLSPLSIWIGGIQIVPSQPLFISGQIGPCSVRIESDYCVVNGLDTRTADSLWYRLASDRGRHRMIPLGGDVWTYEMVREDSIFLNENNLYRFGIQRAIGDNDPVWLSTGALPAWAYEPTMNPSGWFNPMTGQSLTLTAYRQTRICWVCGGSGGDGAGGTCTNCLGIDNDGDGFTDVRKRQSDALARLNASVPPLTPYQGVSFPRPLVLSESLFRFGMNVGVWMEKGFWKGKTEEPLLPATFRDPEWGMFAFASARVALHEPDGTLVCKFFDPLAQAAWVADSPSNLYEEDWDAGLWSMADQVSPEDLAMALDPTTGDYIDTGIGYLMRGFAETGWFDTYDDVNPTWAVDNRLQSMFDKDGRRFDPRAREVENVFRH